MAERTIAGRIVDFARNPVIGVEVSLAPEPPGELGLAVLDADAPADRATLLANTHSAKTDSDGQFSIAFTPPSDVIGDVLQYRVSVAGGGSWVVAALLDRDYALWELVELDDPAAAVTDQSLVDVRIAQRVESYALRGSPDAVPIERGGTGATDAAAARAALGVGAGGVGAGVSLPEHDQADTEVLHSRAGALWWGAVSEVPDTPGDASGVGHVLAVTGEDDRDYAWRSNAAVLPLAVRGGLEFDGAGRLKTTPSLVGTAELADEHGVAITALTDRIDDASNLRHQAVRYASQLQQEITAQETADRPLILYVDATLNATVGGVLQAFSAGAIYYFPPRYTGTSLTQLLNLRSLPSGAVSTAQIAAGAVTEPKLAAEVRTKLNATATDTTARTAATAARTVADRADAATRRLRPVSQWVRGRGAQNLVVEWKPRVAVANGAALGVTVGGNSISGVTAPTAVAAGDDVGMVIVIGVPVAAAGNIDRASATSAGHIEVQIAFGGERDTTWVGYRWESKWRRLAGSSPWTVSADDDEFRIEAQHNRTGSYSVDIARAQLVPGTSKDFTIAENRTDGSNLNDVYVSVLLNATSDSLTATLGGTGANEWTIVAALARRAQ